MTTLNLHPPLTIGPRLLPAVRIDSDHPGTVSLDPSDWTWYVDLDDGASVSGGDFSPPRGRYKSDDALVRDAMGSLLGFLGAFAEARNPRHAPWNAESPDESVRRMNRGVPECYDLFPDEIGEWAYLNEDEIAMACFDLEHDRADQE